MDADFSLLSFVDGDARVRYARRVAALIAEAMTADPKLAEAFLLGGRIGLGQMTDRQLFETGVGAWEVLPEPAEVRAVH